MWLELIGRVTNLLRTEARFRHPKILDYCTEKKVAFPSTFTNFPTVISLGYSSFKSKYEMRIWIGGLGRGRGDL
jgi:hypothetical protein